MVGVNSGGTNGSVKPDPGPGGVGDTQLFIATPACQTNSPSNFVMNYSSGDVIPINTDTFIATLNNPTEPGSNYAWIYFSTDPVNLTPRHQLYMQVTLDNDGNYTISSQAGYYDGASQPETPCPSGTHGCVNVDSDPDENQNFNTHWNFNPNR
jgi:hypothetical protein